MNKKKPICLTLCILVIASSTSLYSWSNHAGITYMILKDHWNTKAPAPVKAESLEKFLIKEKNELPAILDEIDSFVASILSHIPKPIEELKFSPAKITSPENARSSFFRSIRVNPNHLPSLYIQNVKLAPKAPSRDLDRITTMHDKGNLVHESFIMLRENSYVSPIDILTTAVDEPDYDLDLYLFTDNHSDVGKIYGFGEQPFGNPKYEYSSQAPFHMGFFHESKLVFTLASFLRKTSPEYRIYQFSKLSEFAFKTGHPYWGYRFAGWALHYIQDLTQPYHSSASPRISTLKLIWVQLLATLGYDAPKVQIVNFITLRHTLIEEYQYNLVKNLNQSGNNKHIVSQALINPNQRLSKGFWEFERIRTEITKQGFEAADQADLELEELGIMKYEKLYEESHPIHATLARLLTNTSNHTRSFIKSLKAP